MADAPDLNAFLDAQLADAPPDDPDPAPEAPEPDPAPEASTTPADAPEPEPEKTGLNALPDEWQREVREAREEAKRYRLRAKEYEDVYDGLDDDGRAFLLNLNKALKAGDVDTAQQMWDSLALSDPDTAAQVADAHQAAQPPEGKYLTADDLTRMLDERDQKQAQNDAVREIETTAKQLGYEPNSRDYVQLLWLANNQTDGDITAAHEALKAERQQVIDAYLAEKEKAAADSATPAPPTGAAPSGERPITDMKQARSALEDGLDALLGRYAR